VRLSVLPAVWSVTHLKKIYLSSESGGTIKVLRTLVNWTVPVDVAVLWLIQTYPQRPAARFFLRFKGWTVGDNQRRRQHPLIKGSAVSDLTEAGGDATPMRAPGAGKGGSHRDGMYCLVPLVRIHLLSITLRVFTQHA
jgi:hypothetical protein